MSLVVFIENCLHLIIFCLDALLYNLCLHIKKKTSKAEEREANQLYEISECIAFYEKKKRRKTFTATCLNRETKEQQYLKKNFQVRIKIKIMRTKK